MEMGKADIRNMVQGSPLGPTAAESWKHGGDHIRGSKVALPDVVIPSHTFEWPPSIPSWSQVMASSWWVTQALL